MEIVYFGILICSIAFFISAIYISVFLKRLTDVTRSLGYTLKDVEEQFGYITPQLMTTIKEAQQTVDELEENMNATDSVFDSVDNVGKSINSLNDTYKNYKEKITDEQFQKQLKPTVELIKWGEALTQVFKKTKV
ncbi:DUF948 domain-containing protein [Oceanobacillus senegalensis]|uniref:DUF948 domain-containing protein n=1 Tax=Oceanobacillus senegalensis TaxID=1936063 RepID=UPI0015C4E2FA|nr:DUF948 domain-containing protein [Oceanobacillus senegalensis]